MAVVHIPGVGRVNFPASMSLEEIQEVSRRLSSDVGIDPNTGKFDPDLAAIDRLATAEDLPESLPDRGVIGNTARALRNIRQEESLPIMGATIGSIAAPGVGGAVARSLIQTGMAAAGGAAGGAMAESDDPEATAESIARAALESGGEMAMAELVGLGLSVAAARAIAPNLKFLDPLKGVRQDVARYVGQRWPKGETVRQISRRWARLTEAQKAKLPQATREMIEELGEIGERLKKLGKFSTTPIGGEAAEMLAVPAVAALFGPGAALSLSIGKALLNPGPVARYLTRSQLPNAAVRDVGGQAARLGARAAVAEEDADQ